MKTMIGFLAGLAALLGGCAGSAKEAGAPDSGPGARYSLSGSISGLVAGGLVLVDNDGEVLGITSGASNFTFATQLATGAAYAVAVQAQPSGLLCNVSSGQGTIGNANVTNVQVICGATAYTVGGTIMGLTSSGLVLANGADTLTVASGASSFTMPTPLVTGAPFAVTVRSAPATLTCAVSNGSGNLGSAAVTNVAITCSVDAYALGGSVSGLTFGQVVVGSGANTTTISAGESVFLLRAPVPLGATYAVTVQHVDPGTNCTVANGSGVMPAADITNVAISCANGWAWMGGPSDPGAQGTYGTVGVAAAGNWPGARSSAATWVDSSGSVWLFGGQVAPQTDLNDLWNYSPDNGLWTWISGTSNLDDIGSYGTQGIAAAGNSPPSRSGAARWIDTSGNLWLFGGFGYTAGGHGALNDLWTFSPQTGLWTWVSGTSTPYTAGTYAGAGDPTGMPGARSGSASWIDGAGNFWLFGGYGSDGSGQIGDLNDLWLLTRSSGVWSWVGGSSSVGAAGSYGTQGVAAASNVPSGRARAAWWLDASGNVWLFGGDANGQAGLAGVHSDLWRYDPGTTFWTWMGGADNTPQAPTNYGPGAAAPGGRTGTTFWTDASGDLWLFGGQCAGTSCSTGQTSLAYGNLNELWKYSTTTGQWTWVSGSNSGIATGSFGTLGLAALGNVPPGLTYSFGWADKAGKLWLMGGGASENLSVGPTPPSAGSFTPYSALWRY